MKDLYYLGGFPALINEMETIIHNDVITVNGKTMVPNREILHGEEHCRCYAVSCL